MLCYAIHLTTIYSTIQINHCPSHYYSTQSQSDIKENEQFLRATVTK